MRKIKKGEYMHSYTSGPCNDETRWVFPEDFEGLDDNAYYEIESLDDKELEERYKEYCDLLSEMNY